MNSIYLVLDMENDLVHEDGSNESAAIFYDGRTALGSRA